jgi:hypothetical protein
MKSEFDDIIEEFLTQLPKEKQNIYRERLEASNNYNSFNQEELNEYDYDSENEYSDDEYNYYSDNEMEIEEVATPNHLNNYYNKYPLHALAHSTLKITPEIKSELNSILKENFELIHQKDINGTTPLHAATFRGSLDMVKFLVSKGASIHERNNEGKSPIQVAFEQNNLNPNIKIWEEISFFFAEEQSKEKEKREKDSIDKISDEITTKLKIDEIKRVFKPLIRSKL